MSAPKSVLAYEAEWGQIAQLLATRGNFTLPCGDKKKAAFYRLRYYGFRRALTTHDAANPWVAVLQETQATITPEGDLHFERAPLAALLRGMLEHSTLPPGTMTPASNVGASNVGPNDAETPIGAAQETTLLGILSAKKG